MTLPVGHRHGPPVRDGSPVAGGGTRGGTGGAPARATRAADGGGSDQMVPSLTAFSIHGMTSSSMSSRLVDASNPRTRLAFSV